MTDELSGKPGRWMALASCRHPPDAGDLKQVIPGN